jgi:hypothetical protein
MVHHLRRILVARVVVEAIRYPRQAELGAHCHEDFIAADHDVAEAPEAPP